MKQILSVFLAWLLCLPMMAQEVTVRGKVTGAADGLPLPGVNIVVKGTTTGTITSTDGSYSLKVNNGATLIFSSVGQISQEHAALDGILNVALVDETTDISEVVVVGYGVQKKALLTGANMSVKGEDVAQMRTTSAMEALQGVAPGISVTRNSGEPGAGTKIRIRGAGTISGASPLFIVDGVAMGNIDYLNPSDIQTINVLKDAASAAIYGSRAANGVVLVTTKSAQKGASTKIEYDAYYGVQNVYKHLTPLNAQEYMYIMDERRANDGQAPYNWEEMIKNGNTYLNSNFPGNIGDEYGNYVWSQLQSGWKGTNWVKEIAQRNAPVQNHSISISGSSTDVKYAMGISYLDQEGVLGGHVTDAGYKRLTGRLNTEMILMKINGRDLLTVGETFTYTNSQSRTIATGDIYWNDLHNGLVANPLMPLRYDNEALQKHTNGYSFQLEGVSDSQVNPVASMYYRNNFSWGKSNNITGSVYAVLEPIKNLKYRSAYGITAWFGHNRSYSHKNMLGRKSLNTTDGVSQSQSLYANYTWTNTLSYDLKLGVHKISALAGMEANKDATNVEISGSRRNTKMGHPKYAYLNNAKAPTSLDDLSLDGTDWTAEGGGLLSYMGRLSYDFNERYMVDVTFRADGSSNFAKGNQWGYFPSFSAGWNFSEEEFMKDLSWLSFGKLRGSWGQNGNNVVPSFSYLASITSLTNAYFFGDNKESPVDGSGPYRVPNPDLKWETSEQLNIGADLRLLNSKMGVTFDWYKKTTKDWLVEAPVLGTFGMKAPYINGGAVENKGFEIALSWNDQIGEVRYGVTLSGAKNKNEVTELNNAEKSIIGPSDILAQGTSYVSRVEVGKPIGFFYGYKTNGILQNQADVDKYVDKNGNPIKIGTEPNTPRRPGDVAFIDQNGDGVINDADKVMLGKPQADFELGIQLNAEYKGFYFNTTLAGKFGMQVMQSYRTYIDQRENYTTDIFNRWHGEGTSNKIARLSTTSNANFAYVSDMYLHDADYLRISNLTLGYRFDKLLKNAGFIKGATLYTSMNNLYTFTKYDGMDPEVGFGGKSWASGIDLGLYPLARTVMFGVNVTF